MSGELEIPDRAWREFGSSMAYVEILDVKAAARIIVAEAFRRYAEAIEARASDASYAKPEEVTIALLDEGKFARTYADELDPPTVNL